MALTPGQANATRKGPPLPLALQRQYVQQRQQQAIQRAKQAQAITSSSEDKSPQQQRREAIIAQYGKVKGQNIYQIVEGEELIAKLEKEGGNDKKIKEIRYNIAEAYRSLKEPSSGALLGKGPGINTTLQKKEGTIKIEGGKVTGFLPTGGFSSISNPTPPGLTIDSEYAVGGFSSVTGESVFITQSGQKKSLVPASFEPIKASFVEEPVSKAIPKGTLPSSFLEKPSANRFQIYKEPTKKSILKVEKKEEMDILKGSKEFVLKGREASEKIAKSNLALGFIGSFSAGLVSAPVGLADIALNPIRTGKGIKDLGKEFLQNPIRTGGKIVGEQAESFNLNPAFYAGSFTGSELTFRTIGKINAPTKIEIVGESFQRQTKGLAGSGKGVVESEFTGNIIQSRFGRLGETIQSVSKKGSIADEFLTSKTPIKIKETFNLGPVPKTELFTQLAKEKAGPTNEYLVETRGIGKAVKEEVKPQSEILESQFKEGLVVRSTGKIIQKGKVKREFGATGYQTTKDFTGAIRKNESFFPGSFAERQFVNQRLGRVGLVFREGAPGRGEPLTVRIPRKLKKIPDPFAGLQNELLDYRQSVSSVKVESGFYGGYEKVISNTTSNIIGSRRTKITVIERSTTIGKRGFKRDITEEFLSNKTTKDIAIGLEKAKQFEYKQRPVLPFDFSKKKIVDVISDSDRELLKQISRTKTSEVSTFDFSRKPLGVVSGLNVLEEQFVYRPSQLSKLGSRSSFFGLSSQKGESLVSSYSVYSDRSRPVSRFAPRVSFRYTPVLLRSPIVRPLTSPRLKPILRPITTPVSYPIQSPKTFPISTPVSIQIPQTIPVQVPAIIPITIPITRPITKPITRPITIPRNITRLFPSLDFNRSRSSLLRPGYVPVIYRGGKPLKVLSTRPLIETEALALGARAVDTSIFRSIKLIRRGYASPTGLKGPTRIFRRGKRDSGLLVERSAFAISTRGEKSTLRVARKQKRINLLTRRSLLSRL